MQQMDNPMNDNTLEPDVVQAELVEVSPGAPWGWQEVRPVRPRRRWRLPLLLFVATCLSTLLVGMEGVPGWSAALVAGLRYSVPLMTILLCHEMGHFLQARRNHVYASWPYFIPVPVPPLGTMGAVIAMEPRVGHRRALFDIGISGPLAGLVPTVIFCIWGLHQSTFVPIPREPGGLAFGSPILFQALAYWQLGPVPSGSMLGRDPMAFAGWVGLLITSLNLIPIGQLDGGHILYALLRKKAHKVATALLFSAVFLVVWKWESLGNWAPMLVLLFLMGPIHPPTADDDEPLGVRRYILGWLTLAFIFIGFTPMPLQFMQ
jgi:membrane-associated protease RseP (regulator of RpoE activity)